MNDEPRGKAMPDEMRKMLKATEVAAREGVGVSTIWRWVREGRFPAPIRPSRGVTRWRVTDLERWESGDPSMKTFYSLGVAKTMQDAKRVNHLRTRRMRITVIKSSTLGRP